MKDVKYLGIIDKVMRGKQITYALPILALMLFGTASAFAEVCHSPFISYLTKPNLYLDR